MANPFKGHAHSHKKWEEKEIRLSATLLITAKSWSKTYFLIFTLLSADFNNFKEVWKACSCGFHMFGMSKTMYHKHQILTDKSIQENLLPVSYA